MIVFNEAFQAQGFILVDVLPHFCKKKKRRKKHERRADLKVFLCHFFGALNVYVCYPIKDCQFEFNCCFLALNIISSGRRTTVVLRFRIKQKWTTQVSTYEWSLQNCHQVYDNCCILHPHSFSSKPPPPHSPTHTHTRLITHLPILFFFFFFAPKLLMKGADGLFCGWCQLHWVLCQIIYTSFYPTPLGCGVVCVHWTATHARDWQRAKCATLEVPIKMDLKVMKQLLAVVKVSRRPSWPK